MKAILIIGVAVLLMVVGGWVTVTNTDGSTTVTLDKDEVKADTAEAVKKGEDLVDGAVQEGRDLIDRATEKDKNETSPTAEE
ncbi:MAG: hypothetical protein KDA91_07055 [Planctomycetaceae bacterium]|nr:hypothetical protein [Planctomycetaceae bacterium]